MKLHGLRFSLKSIEESASVQSYQAIDVCTKGSMLSVVDAEYHTMLIRGENNQNTILQLMMATLTIYEIQLILHSAGLPESG